jgi:hypothetical protein
MQQLENSATQNRLAQQQMQESAQMAPLRMQEAQARLNTSNLAYDQAKEAKDVIAKVMNVAAENGGPTDPIEIIKQLSMHSNPLIQAAGKHFADSYQLIQGIEQQQKLNQEETGVAAPAAAPTAAYTPQRILVGSQSVQPSALGSGTFDVNAPAPVANAFARTVPSVNALRPGTVTAENVAEQIRQGNKNFGSAPGWAKNREILMKQYEALLNPRQRPFAPIDASKYTPESIRAFNVSGDQSDLVAIAPKNNVFSTLNPKEYTQDSIRAFNISGDYADLVPKEKSDKVVANINAADYTPISVQAFSVSGDYADLVPKEKPSAKNEFEQLLDNSGLSDSEKQAMRIAKLQKETARPEQKAEAKSEFEKLLDASDMTESQKAEARRAKITKETARLEPRPETRSEFEKLLDASNMTEDQKAAARNAKIAKETAGPADKPEARSEFEKLLDASDMTESQKADARRAKITKETAGPTDRPETRSEFEKLLDASNMTESQKADARRARIAKETRIPPTGGDGGEKFPTGMVTVVDPTDPTGKKAIVVTARRAITEGLIPFTSVAKEGSTTEGERKAATLLQRLQFSESQLLTALGEDPNAAKPGLLASAVAKFSDPAANLLTGAARQRVEAAQLDILDAALTLGTGAAYTNEQLKGYAKSYFPQIGDKPDNIKEKQKRLENVIQAARIAAGRAEKSVFPAPNVAPQGTDGFKYLGKEGKK